RAVRRAVPAAGLLPERRGDRRRARGEAAGADPARLSLRPAAVQRGDGAVHVLPGAGPRDAAGRAGGRGAAVRGAAARDDAALVLDGRAGAGPRADRVRLGLRRRRGVRAGGGDIAPERAAAARGRGAAVTLLLVNVFPARRARDLLALLALFAAAGLVVLVRLLRPERLARPEGFRNLVDF